MCGPQISTAPFSFETAVVRSVEPLSTTSTLRTSGSSRRTSAIEASSFKAGITTSTMGLFFSWFLREIRLINQLDPVQSHLLQFPAKKQIAVTMASCFAVSSHNGADNFTHS